MWCYVMQRTKCHDSLRRIKERYRKRRREKFIAQSWKITEEDWTKKRELGLLIFEKWSNNPKFLTNIGASSKP